MNAASMEKIVARLCDAVVEMAREQREMTRHAIDAALTAPDRQISRIAEEARRYEPHVPRRSTIETPHVPNSFVDIAMNGNGGSGPE